MSDKMIAVILVVSGLFLALLSNSCHRQIEKTRALGDICGYMRHDAHPRLANECVDVLKELR